PVMVDPYSQGLMVGAPMKFAFLDQFSIEVLRDLVGFKLHRFLPRADSPIHNAGLAAQDEVNTILPDTELNLGGRAIYQFSPQLSGDARYNIHMPDFEATDAPHELTVGVSYSTSMHLDLAARLGFLDLGQADDSFVA